MKGVIMAGGQGTRLRPLTCALPKPMVPLLDKPCMEYMIRLLDRYGIRDIAVTTQYMPEAIESYFGDGSRFGVRLRYFAEAVPLGTAGGVKNARAFLDERFIVVSGDALTDVDLSELVRFHEAKHSALTVLLSRVPDPLAFGIVLTNEKGRITRFLEKPSREEVFSNTVNTGIYVIEPEILDRMPEETEYDFSKQLFPDLLKNDIPIYGYASDAYWSDIGSVGQYIRSQYDMLEGRVKLDIQAQEISPGVYVAEGARLHPGCVVHGPAFIGKGTRIGKHARIGPYTVIGSGNRVGAGSRVEHSILWTSNRLDDDSDIRGSLLCSRIEAGKEVRIDVLADTHPETGGFPNADSDRIEADSVLFLQ